MLRRFFDEHRKTVKLNTGAEMPLLGLGTFLANNPEDLAPAVKTALDNGYRLIDTASFYKNEDVIGRVLQEYFKSGKLKRKDVFITTKLNYDAMEPAEAAKSIEKQLADLQLDYIDLFLLHAPFCLKHKDPNNFFDVTFIDVPHIDTWRVLEKYHKEGKLKSIGVSNYNAKQLQDLYDKAEIKPAVLQVECNAYWPQNKLLELCHKLNMGFTSYSTLGNPGRAAAGYGEALPLPLNDPVVVELAKKYDKSPAQILLRHQILRGVAVIPKSTNPERIIENGKMCFSISKEDIEKIDAIKTRIRGVDFMFAFGHPQYPFADVIKKHKKEKER